MKIPILRLELYKKIGEDSLGVATYAETPVIINTIKSLTVSYSIGKTKDSIRFSLLNYRKLSDGIYSFSEAAYDFNTKDLILVYGYYYPMEGVLHDHLLMSALVKSWGYDNTGAIGNLNVTAFNRSEVILNSMMFAPYNGGEQVPNMIVDSITKIRGFNVKYPIYAFKDYKGVTSPGTKGAYDQDNNPISGYVGYVRAYKKAAYNEDGDMIFDGSSVPDEYDDAGVHKYIFEDVVFVEDYKPFYTHLDDVSGAKFTKDETAGNYIYYIDNDDNLHWLPKTFVKSGTIVEADSTSVKVSKDDDEIINALIINCGVDPNSNGILTFYIDTTSVANHGAKWKYKPMVDIADKVKEAEILSGTFTNDEDGSTITTGINHPKYIGEDSYPSSFPWTIQTSGSDTWGNWEYEANVDTVSNKGDYKNYFRRVSKTVGKNRAKKIVDLSSNPLYKISYELVPGNNNYVKGSMFTLDIPSIGLTGATAPILRVEKITHGFKDGRWTTILDLKEDSDYNLTQL